MDSQSRSTLWARFAAATLWIAVAALYWWLHPTPVTQITIANMRVPAIPTDWEFFEFSGRIELIYISLVSPMVPFYFWLGPLSQGGSPWYMTIGHAGMAFMAMVLGSYPVRLEWPTEVVTWVFQFLPLQDQYQGQAEEIAAFILLMLALALVATQFRYKMAHRRGIEVWNEGSFFD